MTSCIHAARGVLHAYVQGASGLDQEVITGDYISSIVGVRISTPIFGTGFNFCIGEPPCTAGCRHETCMHVAIRRAQLMHPCAQHAKQKQGL